LLASTRIPRPVEEAFNHVVEPALLSSYHERRERAARGGASVR
jgi:hypothetical protein